MSGIQNRTVILCTALSLLVLAVYANHFQNDFHFDDFHTVTGNPYLRDLRFIPRFFVDPMMFSTLPDHATYRPIVSTSLAIDYWLGHGLKRFPFHLSTFFWYLVQLILMFFLFRHIMDVADPHPSNVWTALVATACYGIHPANAETVNYIIQRADLYNALGVVASLWLYAAYPEQRRRGWYLIPAVLAILAKAPALIYPLILLSYIWLFEGEQDPARRQDVRRYLLRATLPAFLVTIVAAILTAKMTPAVYNPGAMSPSLYRLTQPWISLHYFKCFFLPTDLSADTDWGYVSGPFGGTALLGYLFVLGMLAGAYYASRRRETRPIAFGILWFFLTLLPTSMLPLAEVTNDHRMFFPFVGLTLSIFWSLRLLLFQKTVRLTINHSWVRGAIAGLVVVMTAEAVGTHRRNIVWNTEASLWYDVTLKSPKNGRGLMNYGITFLPRDYVTALQYLERGEALLPNYYYVQVNLGIAYGGLGRDPDAEKHYKRAIELAAGSAEPYIYYAFWLKSRLRFDDAQSALESAVHLNPRAINARHILMQLYYQNHKLDALARMVQETLQLDPRDVDSQRYEAALKSNSVNPTLTADLGVESNLGGLPPALRALLGSMDQSSKNPNGGGPGRGATPENLLNISSGFCQGGRYQECLAAAQQAISMRPLFAEAYNNEAAAYLAMQMWDEGIRALQQALQIKPDYEAAKSNLQYAIAQRQKMLSDK